jgi:MFS family permease
VTTLPAPQSKRLAVSVIGATIAVQVLVSMGVLTLPAIAPRVAQALAVPSTLIGMQVSLLYGFATLASLVSGRSVRRFGAVRTSQAALGFLAAGLACAALPSLAAIAAGSALMGIAYGLPGPAASHLLTRFTPAASRNLIFSVKQTGVPLGGVLAGLVAPPLAHALDWQAPLIVTAIAALGLIASLAAVRARWDEDRDRSHAVLQAPTEGLRTVLSVGPLRSLSGVGFLLAAVQVCIATFLVVLLVEDYGFSVVAAGAAMAGVQVAGVVGRILWGMAADRIGDGLLTLLGLAGLITALALALSMIGPSHTVLALVVLVALGATAIGWNGVFLAETARLAPQGRVGEATAILLAGTYLGVFVGPALFALAVPVMGGYRVSFVLLAAAGAAAALLILVALARRRRL